MIGLAAVLGSSLISGLLSSNAQQQAAETAAAARLEANRQALDAQQRGFGQALDFQTGALGQGNALAQQQRQQLQGIFAPLLGAGQTAIGGLGQFGAGGLQAFKQQLGLSGALGADAQQQAIGGIEGSPIFQALNRQGQDSILANASATGGLRGGNTQAALAQFSPQLLNSLIQQQFQNLGGLSALGSQNFGALGQLGQSGASGMAQGGLGILGAQLGLGEGIARNVAGLQSGNTAAITDLIGQQGSINAGNALAQGQAQAGLFNQINNDVGLAAALGLFGGAQGGIRSGVPRGGFGAGMGLVGGVLS